MPLDIPNKMEPEVAGTLTRKSRRNRARGFRLPTASEFFPRLLNSNLDKKARLPLSSALEGLER